MKFQVLLCLFSILCLAISVKTASYSDELSLFASGNSYFPLDSGIIKFDSIEIPFDGIGGYFRSIDSFLFDRFSKLKVLSKILRAAVEAKATGDILYLYNFIAFNGQDRSMTLDYTSNFKDEVCLFLCKYDTNSTTELSETTADSRLSAYYKNFPVEECEYSREEGFCGKNVWVLTVGSGHSTLQYKYF